MHDSAYDFLTASTAMVFCDQPVAGLSPWLARAHAGAVESGRRFVLLTPSASSLTLPLSALFNGDSASWMATGSDGGFFDAVTGQAQTWDGGTLQPAGTVADDFLAAERSPGAYFHVRASVVHPASLSTRAGTFTERVFDAVTGSLPVGWGLYEPVSETWDASAFSDYCYGRAPLPSRLVVLGTAPGSVSGPGERSGSIAVVTVERTRSGVMESVELLAGARAPLDDAGLDEFLWSMHTARARTAVLAYGLGYRDLLRPARFTGTAVPGAALFGPEALAGRQAAAALASAGPRADLIGTAPAQSLGVRYSLEQVPGELHPLEAYARLAVELAPEPLL
ncbi:DUF6177 family protein [Arthrobacter koreensis]|uniref:DUF6177 family protein n=1 Tax=Arthrobacter koreensis TaxID=199136 RepID=UPI0038068633